MDRWMDLYNYYSSYSSQVICIIGSIAVLSLLLSTINILTAFSQNKLCRLRLLRGPVKHQATLQELSSRISKHRGVSDADDFGHILVRRTRDPDVGSGRAVNLLTSHPSNIKAPIWGDPPIHEIHSTFQRKRPCSGSNSSHSNGKNDPQGPRQKYQRFWG